MSKKASPDKHNINPDLVVLARPIKGLKEDPKNARKHDERNVVAIASSLARFGQQKPIVVTDEGIIIAGNGTFQAAKRMGWTHLAAVKFDKDAASEQLGYAITDNRTAELASWDDVVLAEALQSLNAENDGSLVDFGFTDAEFMKLVAKMEQDADAEAKAAAPEDSAQPLGAKTPPAPLAGENVAASTVRMVQLFLTDETHGKFVERVKFLASAYGTTNVTDTVFEAVARSYAVSFAASSGGQQETEA